VALSTEVDVTAAAPDDAPAVLTVNSIIDAAVEAHASDVYVEAFGDTGRVRQRVDGVLCETQRLAPALLARVVSRLKLLAGVVIRQGKKGRPLVLRALGFDRW
jgi:type IV pilus assembly protein PilB